MLTIKLKAKLTCPKHKKFNPEKDGEGGIKGGCAVCFAIHDVWYRVHTLGIFILRAEAMIGKPSVVAPRIGTSAEL
jgi:hypothetical protein